MHIDTEGLQRAARQASDAADSLRRSTGEIDEAVRKLAQYFEQGYGSPIFALIEVFEALGSKQVEQEVKQRAYFIGQRVIYSNEIAIVCNPPKGRETERNDQWRMWIMRPAVGYPSYVSPENVKPLPGGQL